MDNFHLIHHTIPNPYSIPPSRSYIISYEPNSLYPRGTPFTLPFLLPAIFTHSFTIFYDSASSPAPGTQYSSCRIPFGASWAWWFFPNNLSKITSFELLLKSTSPCISLTGMHNPLTSPSFYLFLFASRIYGPWRQRTYIPSSVIIAGLNFILRNSSMTGT